MAFATVPARFMTAVVMSSLPMTVTAMATSSTPWAYAAAIALLTSTEMASATMQKFPAVRWSQLATITQRPQTTMAAVPPSMSVGCAEVTALPMETVTAMATSSTP